MLIILNKNEEIRTALLNRIVELDFSFKDVISDAKINNVDIDYGNFSRYINGHTKNIISNECLQWLLIRYGINIDLKIQIDKNINLNKFLKKANQYVKS